MSTVVELPFTAQPQSFTVRLVGVPYRVKLAWNIPLECWVVDFADQAGNPLCAGIPLVTGSNLLEQVAYLDFGGQIVVISDHQPRAVPDWNSLGSTGHIYFVVP